MSYSKFSRPGAAVAISVLLGGCAFFQPPPDAADEARIRSEVEADVESTVSAVKSGGSLQLLGSRAVRLPLNPLQSISSYEYQYPETCGSHFFRVLEAGETQILEYSHLREGDGMVFVIRDYVSGPSPFIEPGLWTSYDHTSMDIPGMMVRLVESSRGITPRVYSRGLVTGLAVMTQDELDYAYRTALRAARECASGP